MTDHARPARALTAAGGVCVAGGTAVLVASPRSPWGPVLLGLGLLGLALAVATGLARAARGPEEEIRRPARPETAEAAELVGRRPLLTRALAAGVALLGAGAVGTLWWYGPRRATGTGWADGVRGVDADGRPVRASDLPPGGVVTVWPEGVPRNELAATVVLRLALPAADDTEPPGAVLAYSRVCTHAGCPVALFRADEGVLYCPCHQATFDATRDAVPVSGPAPTPLPRLPVAVDAEGFLVARGDFDAPPGPPGGGGAP